MYGAGILYRLHGDHPWSTAALKGVAAAAVGLILATVMNLSKKALAKRSDLIFVVATAVAVEGLHWSVPRAADNHGNYFYCVSPSYQQESRVRRMNELPALIGVFSYLSLLTVGGGMAAFPEMKHLHG